MIHLTLALPGPPEGAMTAQEALHAALLVTACWAAALVTVGVLWAAVVRRRRGDRAQRGGESQ